MSERPFGSGPADPDEPDDDLIGDDDLMADDDQPLDYPTSEHAGEDGDDGEADADALNDDEDDDADDLDEDDDDEEEGLESVTVEITGLSLYTHHGASEAEREVGQRLVLDLRLDLGEADATATDRLEDTVDYAQVCQLVALIAQQRSYRTLERLCATIAERMLIEYELESVWVKATKPEPPIPLPVEGVSVEVWREAN